MEITPKFAFVDGSFNTETVEMLCIPDDKKGRVDLCIRELDKGWSFPIGSIKLHSENLYVDFKATLKEATELGEEIARRWNECPTKK